MKRLVILIVVMAVALAGKLWAADEPVKSGASRTAGNVREGGQPGAVSTLAAGSRRTEADFYTQNMDKIVGLTEAQKTAIIEIFAARNKDLTEFQAQNADKLQAAGKALREAFRKGDQEAVVKAQREYQELYAPMHQIIKNSQADLDRALTSEQKNKLQDSRLTSAVKSLAYPVQLGDEQIAKIKTAWAELSKDGRNERFYEKLPQVVQQVLTPEQKTTIARHRTSAIAKAVTGRVALTPAQSKQLDACVEEIAKDTSLKPEDTYKKVLEKVNGLLTAEQKEAVQQRFLVGRGQSNTSPTRAPGIAAPAAGVGPATVTVLQSQGGGSMVQVHGTIGGAEAAPDQVQIKLRDARAEGANRRGETAPSRENLLPKIQALRQAADKLASVGLMEEANHLRQQAQALEEQRNGR